MEKLTDLNKRRKKEWMINFRSEKWTWVTLPTCEVTMISSVLPIWVLISEPKTTPGVQKGKICTNLKLWEQPTRRIKKVSSDSETYKRNTPNGFQNVEFSTVLRKKVRVCMGNDFPSHKLCIELCIKHALNFSKWNSVPRIEWRTFYVTTCILYGNFIAQNCEHSHIAWFACTFLVS